MEKPKYYGKQADKEKYPYKKKEKSTEDTYTVEDDLNWASRNEYKEEYV